MRRGVLVVAYGTPARREAKALIGTVGKHLGLPVAVVSDRPLGETPHVNFPAGDPGARLAKLSQDSLSPWDQTLYLDADTRLRGDIDAGFGALDDGWELVLAPSERQGEDVLGNCAVDDRALTAEALGTRDVLGLQAGVMFWRRCEAVSRLFAAWREEWARFKSRDQAALLRALRREPARVWLLGHDWNGGSLVEHRFGRARAA